MTAATDIATAKQQVQSAYQFLVNGSQATVNDYDAATYFQTAAVIVAKAAVLASNAAQQLAISNPSAEELAIDAFNASEASTDALNDTYGYKTRVQIKAAAIQALQAAGAAISLAEKIETSGAVVPSVGGASQATQQAASAVSVYLSQHGCDCTGGLYSVTFAFQAAYNADVAGGTISGVSSIPDTPGKYGYGTQHALSLILGTPAPANCWGDGGACYGKLINFSGAPTQEQLTPGTIPDHPQGPQGAGPWIASAIILGAAAFLVHREGGFTPKAAVIAVGAAGASVAAFTLWPKAPIGPTPQGQSILHPVTSLSNGQIYVITVPINTFFEQNFNLLQVQGTGWLVEQVLYYPGKPGAWPGNLSGMETLPTSQPYMAVRAKWNRPSGPVPTTPAGLQAWA